MTQNNILFFCGLAIVALCLWYVLHVVLNIERFTRRFLPWQRATIFVMFLLIGIYSYKTGNVPAYPILFYLALFIDRKFKPFSQV